MKFIAIVLSTVLLATVFSACSRKVITFSSETIRGADFTRYKTFAFLPLTDTAYGASIADKKKLEYIMAKEAASKLTRKGMMLDTLNPDCFFKYSLNLQRTYELADVQDNIQYAGQTYEAFSPVSTEKIYFFSKHNKPVKYSSEFSIDTLKGGCLVIDMIDAENSTLLWRSKAIGSKEQNKIPSMKQVVHNIIPRMFKHFPKK